MASLSQRIRCAVFAVSATLLLPAIAGAQESSRWDPISQRNDAEATLVWNSAKIWGSAFGLVPAVHYEVRSQVFVDVLFPLTLNIGGPGGGGSEAHAALGNPTIGAHYASTKGLFTWFAGARLSLPLAAFHGTGYQLADHLALTAFAAYDSYLWAREYVPITLSIGGEYRVIPALYLRASIDSTLLISTTSRDYLLGGNHASIFETQLHLEGEFRSSMGLGGGLGMLGVFQLTSSRGDRTILNDDRAQLAVNPFVSYDNGSLFARLGMLIALDSPLGFGFDHSSFLLPTTASLYLQFGKHLQ